MKIVSKHSTQKEGIKGTEKSGRTTGKTTGLQWTDHSIIGIIGHRRLSES